ncbi:MAG: hypothetical protein J0I08_20770 [Rhizobiales bacterium]|nr:hypothetical protein [Hyphomicrobiales bacterium]
MRTSDSPIVGRNDYLVGKFAQLQLAARHALADIDAIPERVSVVDEFEAVQFALAPVERIARSFMLLEASSAAAAMAKDRVKAWLDGGKLVDIVEPLGLAA